MLHDTNPYLDHKWFLWIPTRTDIDNMAAVVAHGRRKGQLKSTGRFIFHLFRTFLLAPNVHRMAECRSVCTYMAKAVVETTPALLAGRTGGQEICC